MMLDIQSEEQAVTLLKDGSQSISNREATIHYLGRNPSNDNVTLIIEALGDNDFGIRWTAAVALAQAGEAAMQPLLQTLVNQHDSAWLREGTHHILHYSKSQKVREESAELQKALRGLAAEVMTTREAAALLENFRV